MMTNDDVDPRKTKQNEKEIWDCGAREKQFDSEIAQERTLNFLYRLCADKRSLQTAYLQSEHDPGNTILQLLIDIAKSRRLLSETTPF